VVSRIAVMEAQRRRSRQGVRWVVRFRRHRQRAEQNRACSRRGANDVTHARDIGISHQSHVTRHGWLLPRLLMQNLTFISVSF